MFRVDVLCLNKLFDRLGPCLFSLHCVHICGREAHGVFHTCRGHECLLCFVLSAPGPFDTAPGHTVRTPQYLLQLGFDEGVQPGRLKPLMLRHEDDDDGGKRPSPPLRRRGE